MTNEEMRDWVGLIYQQLRGPTDNAGHTTHHVHVGAARRLCAQVMAALEAEPEPLAVDDHSTLERGSDGWYRLRQGRVFFNGQQDWPASFPVTVIVTERKT